MKKENKKEYIIYIIICLMIIAPMIIIGIYNRPSADDYDYAIITHQAVQNKENIFGLISAAWKTNVEFYNKWQGLYSSAFILSLQPAIFGEKMYALTPLIVILYAYIFMLLSINILNKLYIKKSFLYSVTLSLILLTLLLNFLPSPTEGLYWFNGAMNYMPWVFTNIFIICMLLYIKDKPLTKKNIVYLIIVTILSFLTSGGNHVTAFANILQLLFISIYFIKNKKYHLVLPLLTACIGFIIMYIAPGTMIRANALQESSFIKTIIAVILKMRRLMSTWINVEWLLSLIVITPLAIEISNKYKSKFSIKLSLITLLLSLIIICGMLAVPYYAMSSFGEGRVTNVIWINFMILSFINYILLLGLLSQKNIISINKKINNISIILICSGLILSTLVAREINSTSLTATLELLNGTAKQYSIEMDDRIKLYNDPTLKEVKVRPCNSKSMLFFTDIGPNPNQWPNTSISEYYNKKIYLIE